MRELIRDISHDKAIVISTHILEEVDAVCDRAVVIARALLADGTPERQRARAPQHNAVLVSVAPTKHGQLRRQLKKSMGSCGGDGSVWGQFDAPQIVLGSLEYCTDRRRVVADKDIPVDELLVERGCWTMSFMRSRKGMAMRNVVLIAKRELKSHFATPVPCFISFF